jgi:hypothetical protein
MTTTRPSRFAAATAPPAPQVVRLPAGAVSVPLDMLDGGEIVILAIKPSLWFLLFEPLKWIAAAVLLLLCVPLVLQSVPVDLAQRTVVECVLLLLAVRVAVGALRWVSRFYVLTNRRVMRVQGVFHADVWACPLVRVRNTRLTADPHERVARLGTIEFVTDDVPAAAHPWRFIARPAEVHAEVRRAIQRALDNHSPV